MNLILFDDRSWEDLLPLTFTRPISKLRAGILTISEKWEHYSGHQVSFLTRPHLQKKFPVHRDTDNLMVNSALLPDRKISEIILKLDRDEALFYEDKLIAARIAKEEAREFEPEKYTKSAKEIKADLKIIRYPWNIFQFNGKAIQDDYNILTRGRKSEKLSNTVNCINPENIFAEPGFTGEYITINASTGPVFLGRNSEIMEGSVIRGPFALCESSTVKMAAKIYGPTTIGPYCKVGGEINNSLFHGYSNKAHDGFLGNSVIGEWCNMGADSNNSNLKNNYTEVKAWNYPSKRFIPTGLQFCGLIMGDHSKCGINTMFNTGTVVGISANIFGSGFPRTFIPSFSWGGASGMLEYRLEKALETAKLVMDRREIELSDDEVEILDWIYSYSSGFRGST